MRLAAELCNEHERNQSWATRPRRAGSQMDRWEELAEVVTSARR